MDEKQLTKLIRLAEEGDSYLQEQIDETDTRVSKLEKTPELSIDGQVEKVAMKLATKLAVLEKGDKGDMGLPGRQGEEGPEGPQGEKGERGFSGKDGKDGKEGRDGRDGVDGRDGQDGEKGDDGSPDTPDEIIQKINKSHLLISKDRIDGLVDSLSQMIHSAVGITTTIFFKNGTQVGRAKNINLTGSAVSSVSVIGDTANIILTGGAGGGQVNSVVAGTGISVDNTDPANPIVTNTGSSPNFADNEVASGSGTTYTLAHTPVAGSQHVYGAGVRLTSGNDYTISSATITIINGSYATGEVLCDYRF